MARNVVRTWIHRDTGEKTSRVTIRVEYHMDLSEMIEGLCSQHARFSTSGVPEDAPQSLNALKISDTVRDEYSYHGVAHVREWTDYYRQEEVMAWRRWAEGVIVEAIPGLGEYR